MVACVRGDEARAGWLRSETETPVCKHLSPPARGGHSLGAARPSSEAEGWLPLAGSPRQS